MPHVIIIEKYATHLLQFCSQVAVNKGLVIHVKRKCDDRVSPYHHY